MSYDRNGYPTELTDQRNAQLTPSQAAQEETTTAHQQRQQVYPLADLQYTHDGYPNQQHYQPVASGSGLDALSAFAPHSRSSWWPQPPQHWEQQIYQPHPDWSHQQQFTYREPHSTYSSTSSSPAVVQGPFRGLDSPSGVFSPLQARSREPSELSQPVDDTLLPRLQAALDARIRVRTTDSVLPPVKPPREGRASHDGDGHSSAAARSLELSVPCGLCGQRPVRLVLRGPAIRNAQFKPKTTFNCALCLSATGQSQPASARSRERWYHQTMSAALDKLQGFSNPPKGNTPRVVLDPNQEFGSSMDRLKCDCCLHLVGTGKVTSSLARGSPSNFTSEIVCSACISKYKCCSDCGGGGGRLTIGRWRCAELFPLGRKTCRLSHSRQPKMDELEWSVKAIPEIEPNELDCIIAGCRSLYFTSRLQTTARPEVLEHGAALCSTYDQAEKLTIDSWNLIEPLFSQVIEHTHSIRRYLTLQTSVPSSRRAKSKAKNTPRGVEEPIIAGFLLVEWDMLIGSIFIACQMPWERTGDAYDAVSRCGIETMVRIRADHAEENAKRAKANEQLLPEIKCSWLLSPFSEGSRSYVNLRGRGYVELDELREDVAFVLWEEGARKLGGAFPPDRNVQMPAQFVDAFHISVRLFDDVFDLGGPPMVKRRPKKKKAGSPSPPVPPSRRKK